MKITSVEYLVSARSKTDYPKKQLPQIAFSGRSNVGKSSLLNALLKRKRIARTSSTPGKTQCINFFLINDSFYFVDLPGYGYAKAPWKERQKWGQIIEEYLQWKEIRKMVVLLVDIRHESSPLDLQMKSWLDFHQLEYIIAATKADKLSTSRRTRCLNVLEQAFTGTAVIPFSAVKGLGRLKLWGLIKGFIESE